VSVDALPRSEDHPLTLEQCHLKLPDADPEGRDSPLGVHHALPGDIVLSSAQSMQDAADLPRSTN
jgi:hypothetical protein